MLPADAVPAALYRMSALQALSAAVSALAGAVPALELQQLRDMLKAHDEANVAFEARARQQANKGAAPSARARQEVSAHGAGHLLCAHGWHLLYTEACVKT